MHQESPIQKDRLNRIRKVSRVFAIMCILALAFLLVLSIAILLLPGNDADAFAKGLKIDRQSQFSNITHRWYLQLDKDKKMGLVNLRPEYKWLVRPVVVGSVAFYCVGIW